MCADWIFWTCRSDYDLFGLSREILPRVCCLHDDWIAAGRLSGPTVPAGTLRDAETEVGFWHRSIGAGDTEHPVARFALTVGFLCCTRPVWSRRRRLLLRSRSRGSTCTWWLPRRRMRCSACAVPAAGPAAAVFWKAVIPQTKPTRDSQTSTKQENERQVPTRKQRAPRCTSRKGARLRRRPLQRQGQNQEKADSSLRRNDKMCLRLAEMGSSGAHP